MDVDEIPIALRVWTRRRKEAKPRRTKRRADGARRNEVLVFDTETSTDPTQRLQVLAWQLLVHGIGLRRKLGDV